MTCAFFFSENEDATNSNKCTDRKKKTCSGVLELLGIFNTECRVLILKKLFHPLVSESFTKYKRNYLVQRIL